MSASSAEWSLRPWSRQAWWCGGSLHCPGDGSVFRAGDGAVLDGPATPPIPRFEARRVASGVEIRSTGRAG